MLRKTSPDTSAIRDLATGVTLPDQGVIASLRALSQIGSPDLSSVSACAQRLRQAVSAMSSAGEVESGRRMARLELRRSALRLHAQHGEQSCPVCAQGSLDETWAEASTSLVAQEASELRELEDASAELVAARNALTRLVSRCPAALDQAPTEALNAAVMETRASWSAFAEVPQGDLELADHLELHVHDLSAHLESL